MPSMFFRDFLRTSAVIFLLLTLVVWPAFSARAAWNGQYYDPGETLDPECAPTDANCDVNPVTDPTHGGTGLTSYSAGDLLYASSASTLGTLALGVDGKVLKVVGGVLAWADDTVGTAFTADGNGIELSSSTFSLELDGASLAKSADGLRISATYAGQNTITTLGTIATGVWNGTAIGDAYLTKTGDWTGTLDGTEGAAFLARANHTGSQTASTISDFSTAVAALLSTGNGLVVNGTAFGLVLDGASLTKSIDGLRLSASYAGQNTITTLGTIATGVWNGTAIGDAYVTKSGDWTGTLDGLEGAAVALLAGRAGGQTLIGGTASGENLTLQSTGNATKGKILFGTSAYDEVNNRLGLGTTGPVVALHISRTDTTGLDVNAPQILADNPATAIGGSSVFRARTGTGYSTYPEIWMEAQTGVNGVVRLRGVSNHSMEIRTADVTRLRIDSTGYSTFPTAPTASANYGAVNIGATTAFNGSTSGFFVGSASGTQLAINAASGYAGNLIDAQIAGALKFRVTAAGGLTITGNLLTDGDLRAGAGSSIYFTNSSQISSATNGNLKFSNFAGSDFGLLQFGGTTSSFPAIKRSGTGIEIRLADDSGYAPLTSSTVLTSSLITSNGGFLASSGNTAFTSTGTSTIASGSFASFNNPKSFAPTSGTGVFAGYEFSGTINQTGGANGISRGLYINPTLTAAADFRALEISAGRTVLSGTELTSWGGITSSFPAIKRNSAGLDFRLADDSGYANINTKNIIATQGFSMGNGLTNTSLGFGFGRNFTTGAIFDSGRYSFQFTRPGNGDRLDLEIYDGAGTLAARNTVDSAGSTGLGTISPGSYKLRVLATRQAASGDIAIASFENAGTSSADVLTLKQTGEAGSAESQFITFYTNAGLIGSIASNGSGVTSYNTTSDRRLKDNIEDTEYSIDDVLKIPVREYTMRQDPKALKQTGFIAQELAAIYPDAVSASGDDGISPLDGKTPWSIDYGRLTPLLVKAAQDQQLLLGDIADKDGLSELSAQARGEAPLSAIEYIGNKVGAGWRPLLNFAALRVTALRAYADEVFARRTHQEELCIGTPGNETCLNKAQLDNLLNSQSAPSQDQPAPPPPSDAAPPPSDETPPPIPAE